MSSDIDSYVACRALSMKGRPISNYRLSPSLFRRNTHNICCMDSTLQCRKALRTRLDDIWLSSHRAIYLLYKLSY